MADEERSDSVQSIELPSDLLNLVMMTNGGGQPAQMDLTTIDGIPGFTPQTLNDLNQPKLNILEQPKSRGFRFRYGCEGPSHGGLPGVNSQKGSRKRTYPSVERGFRFRYKCEEGSHGGLPGANSQKGAKTKKTYPSIEIQNYKGPARIVVSLVTNDEIPIPHAYSLVGKNCTNGVCTVHVGPNNMTATFPNLGILHVTRKDVKKVLKERMMESKRIYNNVLRTPVSEKDMEKEVEKTATECAKNMDLAVMRLNFTAYLPDQSGNFTQALAPTMSVPVYDCKALNAATLKICRMDRSSGCATGGDEVYLLCDKVQKEDIQVRFFEMNDEGAITWEANADFGPTDVHRQYAIVFKTPAYHNPNIDRQKYVQVQLKRRTDGDTSDPKPFTYFPKEHDREFIQRKRKKPLPHFQEHFGSGRSFGPASGSGSSGFHGNAAGGSGQAFNFGNTTVPGSFNFPQQSAGGTSYQSLPVTTGAVQPGSQPQQPQVQVQPNTISKQMQQQIQIQQQQIRQAQLAHRQQQQLQLQQQQQQQMSSMYHPRPGVTMQPRGIGGIMPSVEECSSKNDRVVPQLTTDTKKVVKKEEGELQVDSAPVIPQDDDDDDLETGSAPVVQGRLEIDSVPFADSDSEDYKEKRKHLARFVGQETVTNLHDEDIKKVFPKIQLEDSGNQTDAMDLEYDTLAWRLAERSSNAMRDYAITGDIRMLLAVQRHLTAVEDDNGDTALHLAIIHKKYEVAFALLSVIISIPKQKIVNQYNKLKQTPLHLAVITDQARMVDLLLRCGADPNMIDGNGNMPIHIASKEKFTEITQVLCRGPVAKPACPVIKADVNARNLDGFTAAHLAIKANNLRNLKMLVKYGADVNVADGNSGRTGLHHAVQRSNLSILGYLITDAEADIHAINFAGDTPLHIASSLDYVAVASLLIATGADILCQNYDFGDVSLDEAEEEGGSGEEGEREEEEVIREEAATQEGDEEEELSGKTPMDLAKSERMKAVLQGTPYNPVEGIQVDPMKAKRNLEFLESGYKSHTPSADEGHTQSIKGATYSFYGDLHRVDCVARQELGELLDTYSPAGLDWTGVAEKVGLGNMVNNLRLMNNPTLELLKHYEEMDGTLDELMTVLKEIKRQDAVHVLLQCTKIKPAGKQDTRWDSAFGTLEESMQDMSLANAS